MYNLKAMARQNVNQTFIHKLMDHFEISGHIKFQPDIY